MLDPCPADATCISLHDGSYRCQCAYGYKTVTTQSSPTAQIQLGFEGFRFETGEIGNLFKVYMY